MNTRRDDRSASARTTWRRGRRARYAATAAGLLAFCGIAGGASAQGAPATNDQDLQNRLLGKPSAAASQPTPDCSTPQALENNPDCGQPVKGGERGFKLFDHAAPTPAAHPATGAGARKGGGAMAAPRRQRSERAPSAASSSAAASCAMADASTSRAVNLCVTFAMNSTALTSQSRQSLDQLVKALNSPQISSRDVVIEGYADSTGAAAANLRLSDARARAVADYLSGHGTARSRIEAKGLGATNFLPGRPSTDPANRRVEARLKD